MPNHGPTQAVAFGRMIADADLDALYEDCDWFIGWFRDKDERGDCQYHFFFESMISRTKMGSIISEITGLRVSEFHHVPDVKMSVINRLRRELA